MKLALHQGPSPAGDTEAAFHRIETLLWASQGASMLLLPELFLPGYNQAGRPANSGGWVRRMQAMAKAARCGVTFGWAEASGNVVYNSASAIGPDGALLAHYRKIQLFGHERDVFAAGNSQPPVFDFQGRKLGLLICYDIEFPHHAAGLSQRGAEIVLVPTANPVGYDHVPRILVPARAYENRQIIAYANLCGREGDLEYAGGSVIVGPDAEPIASAGRNETLLICDLPAIFLWDAHRLSTQAKDLRPL